MRSLLSVALMFLPLTASAGERLNLGHVDNDLSSSEGCSLQLLSDFARKQGSYIFVSNYENDAVVNINGSTVHLHLSRKQPASESKLQLGDRATFWYKSDELQVRVDYVVTGLCPSGNESCGVTSYDAILSLKRGKQNKTVAAKGVCSR